MINELYDNCQTVFLGIVWYLSYNVEKFLEWLKKIGLLGIIRI